MVLDSIAAGKYQCAYLVESERLLFPRTPHGGRTPSLFARRTGNISISSSASIFKTSLTFSCAMVSCPRA